MNTKLSYWRRNARIYCSMRGDGWDVFLGGVRLLPLGITDRDIDKLLAGKGAVLREKGIDLGEVASRFRARCDEERKTLPKCALK